MKMQSGTGYASSPGYASALVKRVLVLAYYFPPLGGAGVQRTVKLIKHLPSLGYRSIVVTGPESGRVAWAPIDRTLVTDLPPDTLVRRLHDEPVAMRKWTERARRWLDRPSSFSAWWVEGAVSAARDLHGAFDVVYASLSPFETAAAAAQIADEAGVPWIADLRDPWALDEWTVYPTSIHRRRDERRMRSQLGRADAVVLNTKEAAVAARTAFPELADRIEVIPNGWDADDFTGPPPVRDDAAYRIVYVGYSHFESGRRHRRLAFLRTTLGGATRGLDIFSRSEVYLLEAVENLVDASAELGGRIEVHVAGASGGDGSATGRTRAHHHGYLAHDDAVDLIRSADLLFLPMHDLPPGVRSRTVPGKTYEYLASGRPILAALPDGDARDLLTGLPHVRLCRPRDVACMSRAIEWFVGEGPQGCYVNELAQEFERRRLAERLAATLDGVVGTAAPERS